jgi:WD40 repeat protein
MEVITPQNAARLTEQIVLQPHEGPTASMAFSPDGGILAVDSNNRVELWRIADGTLLGTLPVGWPGAEGLAFSVDGTVLAAVSGNAARFSLWDVATRTLLRQVSVPLGHQPGCVAMTPSGRTLATGGFDGQVLLWDWGANNPVVRSTLAAHTIFVSSLAFSANGLVLASGANNGELRLWEIGFDLLPTRRWSYQAGHLISDVSFDPRGDVLAASSWDGKLYLMDVEHGTIIRTLSNPRPGRNDQMAGVHAPHADLIAAQQGGILQLWEPSTGALLVEKETTCHSLRFSPGGTTLAALNVLPADPNAPVTIWGPRRVLVPKKVTGAPP